MVGKGDRVYRGVCLCLCVRSGFLVSGGDVVYSNTTSWNQFTAGLCVRRSLHITADPRRPAPPQREHSHYASRCQLDISGLGYTSSAAQLTHSCTPMSYCSALDSAGLAAAPPVRSLSTGLGSGGRGPETARRTRRGSVCRCHGDAWAAANV